MLCCLAMICSWSLQFVYAVKVYQKNPRAHKNKIGTPPPKKKNPNTPPLKRGILWTWFFLQKERIFPGVHKIGVPISGPRIADTNFTDTRIFLKCTLRCFRAIILIVKVWRDTCKCSCYTWSATGFRKPKLPATVPR